VVIALIILQILSLGLNLMGDKQYLSTSVCGLFLITVMVVRYLAGIMIIFNHRRIKR